ncbi:HNH endonuclease [Rhodobacter sp. JA431]|uniref:HNH endonuclease signature motif containing protein n=1 Tax=Rhodobacter sp. JA431 TaxID=570013 RepID=UPI000BD617C6|nr:HNH endonuclease signature motif containing protein [Rhodobacter sp. JA431]SOC11406.1 HNH endonuclease [Rhodobacter sp. JA431]
MALPGGSRCAEHLARDKQRKANHARSADAALWHGIYSDPRWKKAAAAFLKAHPLCADCGELGVVEAATEVDHIERHMGDPRKFWDKSNWQPLCKRCHSRKTAREVWHSKG